VVFRIIHLDSFDSFGPDPDPLQCVRTKSGSVTICTDQIRFRYYMFGKDPDLLLFFRTRSGSVTICTDQIRIRYYILGPDPDPLLFLRTRSGSVTICTDPIRILLSALKSGEHVLKVCTGMISLSLSH
jgi:hypothetical protein